uniref:Uncharacterized protein n=1 Tax=Arundo donax TaxID=35708 RepID=A0A0A9BE93_ARUDO
MKDQQVSPLITTG